MNKVAVFGSLNMDIIVSLDSLPQPGETVAAQSIDYRAGGKGLNQAAAAAAVGASTIMIGCVGEDAFGQQIIAAADRVIDLDGSRINNIKGEATGIASIMTAGDENIIAVVEGANKYTNRKYAEENRTIFEQADVVLVQFEVPEDGVEEALKAAKFGQSAITILNPAPYRSFNKELLKLVDVITPNETEFADMAKDFGITEEGLNQQMVQWSKLYPDIKLIVTQGSKGLSYIEGTNIVSLEAAKVKQVDPTGAGDTFCGVLGALLSKNMPFEEAVFKSAVAAGLSVEHKGALGSAPKMQDIDLYLSKDQEGADTTNF